MPAPTGNQNGRKKVVGYHAAHYRVRAARGFPGDHSCACGAQAQEWAYGHTDPNELTQKGGQNDGQKYSLDPSFYEPMCLPCHRGKDCKPGSNQGSKSGRARVNEEQVVDIRHKYATGEMNQAELGDLYGIDYRTVSYIVRRLTWKHVK